MRMKKIILSILTIFSCSISFTASSNCDEDVIIVEVVEQIGPLSRPNRELTPITCSYYPSSSIANLEFSHDFGVVSISVINMQNGLIDEYTHYGVGYTVLLLPYNGYTVVEIRTEDNRYFRADFIVVRPE